MASLVIGYSSEEEEEDSYDSKRKMSKNGLTERQKDVNYDDVKMEMSDESDRERDEKRKSDSEMKREEHKSNRKVSEEASRNKEKSSDEERSHSKHSKHEDRHRSHRHHRRHREERRHDGDRHRRKHRRRSRSRDHRRSRSKERSRTSRDDPEYERMSKHSRKLKALGLVGQKNNEEPAEDSHSESANKKFPSGSASGLLINEGTVKKQVEAQVAQVKQITGVDLPKYYNPTAINPLRYADQIKKRKLLWSKPSSSNAEEKTATETESPSGRIGNPKLESGAQSSSYNNWESTNFGNSQANEKFRRLMGIKTPSVPTAKSGAEAPVNQKMFQDLDKQYEKARITTHTARGLGLGFSNPIPMNSVGSIDDNAKK